VVQAFSDTSKSTGQGAVVMTNSDNGSQLINEVLRAIAREYGWTNYLVATAPLSK
jgi:hypothetical protein